jgi:hypothetical protein
VCGNAKAIDVYYVGNSLTWDSSPGRVGGFAESIGETHNTGHHIRCSWSLTHMLTDPTNTCVTPTSFGTFEPALSQNMWDALMLQPHTNQGTTLKSEADAILSMIRRARSNDANTNTKFYIYTDWPTRSSMLNSWTTETADEDDTPFSRRRASYDHVYNRVTAATDAEVYMIPIGEIIDKLATSIEAGDIAGLTNLCQLYRDNIHMSYGLGRYVASAATFSTLYGHDLEGITLPGYSTVVGDAVNVIIWNEVSTNPLTGVPEHGAGLIVLLASVFGLQKRRPGGAIAA